MTTSAIVKRVRRAGLRLSAAVATSGLFLFVTETAASASNWGSNHVEGLLVQSSPSTSPS